MLNTNVAMLSPETYASYVIGESSAYVQDFDNLIEEERAKLLLMVSFYQESLAMALEDLAALEAKRAALDKAVIEARKIQAATPPPITAMNLIDQTGATWQITQADGSTWQIGQADGTYRLIVQTTAQSSA